MASSRVPTSFSGCIILGLARLPEVQRIWKVRLGAVSHLDGFCCVSGQHQADPTPLLPLNVVVIFLFLVLQRELISTALDTFRSEVAIESSTKSPIPRHTP